MHTPHKHPRSHQRPPTLHDFLPHAWCPHHMAKPTLPWQHQPLASPNSGSPGLVILQTCYPSVNTSISFSTFCPALVQAAASIPTRVPHRAGSMSALPPALESCSHQGHFSKACLFGTSLSLRSYSLSMEPISSHCYCNKLSQFHSPGGQKSKMSVTE